MVSVLKPMFELLSVLFETRKLRVALEHYNKQYLKFLRNTVQLSKRWKPLNNILQEEQSLLFDPQIVLQ